MEPPEMAVFSFIDLPGVLTHEKKGEHIVKKKINKYNFTKEEQDLYDKLFKLSKTTKVRPRKMYNRLSYQIIQNKETES